MKRVNFPRRRQRRQGEAQTRQLRRASRSPRQQLQALDERGAVARKERKRLR